MIFPETGDLWEYKPEPFNAIYLIMEQTKTKGRVKSYMILRLEDGAVSEYDFPGLCMDLWRKLA